MCHTYVVTLPRLLLVPFMLLVRFYCPLLLSPGRCCRLSLLHIIRPLGPPRASSCTICVHLWSQSKRGASHLYNTDCTTTVYSPLPMAMGVYKSLLMSGPHFQHAGFSEGCKSMCGAESTTVSRLSVTGLSLEKAVWSTSRPTKSSPSAVPAYYRAARVRGGNLEVACDPPSPGGFEGSPRASHVYTFLKATVTPLAPVRRGS